MTLHDRPRSRAPLVSAAFPTDARRTAESSSRGVKALAIAAAVGTKARAIRAAQRDAEPVDPSRQSHRLSVIRSPTVAILLFVVGRGR